MIVKDGYGNLDKVRSTFRNILLGVLRQVTDLTGRRMHHPDKKLKETAAIKPQSDHLSMKGAYK